ncbi:MAG: hypothetical protein GKR88_16420 [Flavobacteriaceae bacterium]|nr:MAG: hypothetical protein GKR88_16420 [Flavobacteriaceae bacterium]
MSFFKKIFNLKDPAAKKIKEEEVQLSLDDAFVHHFIWKGGKFLYCLSEEELKTNLNRILLENQWNKVACLHLHEHSFIKDLDIEVTSKHNSEIPFFTNCEHLISDCGDILFSSNQIGGHKLVSLTENFIVFAKTSQLVKDIGEGLTGIKTNYKNIPTNISAVRNYRVSPDDDSFLHYGNGNAKNLYLLLLEDL